MAGRGFAPKEQSVTHHKPQLGDFRASPGVGWQHGPIPPCPYRGAAVQAAWKAWMEAWFASNWSPQDLPGLKMVAKMYAKVAAGELRWAAELRLQMDGYGITPKGQQTLRWKPPKVEPVATPDAPKADPGAKYAYLRAVPGD
jgi:hypothetical protein